MPRRQSDKPPRKRFESACTPLIRAAGVMTAEQSLHLWRHETSGEIRGNYRIVVGNLGLAVSSFAVALTFSSDCDLVVQIGEDELGAPVWGKTAELTFTELEGRVGTEVDAVPANLAVRVLEPDDGGGAARIRAHVDVSRIKFGRTRDVRDVEGDGSIMVDQWPSL